MVLGARGVDRGSPPELAEHVALDADEVEHEVADRGALHARWVGRQSSSARLWSSPPSSAAVEMNASSGDEPVSAADPAGCTAGRARGPRRVEHPGAEVGRQVVVGLEDVEADLEELGAGQVHAGFLVGEGVAQEIAQLGETQSQPRLGGALGDGQLDGDLPEGAAAVVGEDDRVPLLGRELVEGLAHVRRHPRPRAARRPPRRPAPRVTGSGAATRVSVRVRRTSERTRSTLRRWASTPSQERRVPRAGSNRSGCSQRKMKTSWLTSSAMASSRSTRRATPNTSPA